MKKFNLNLTRKELDQIFHAINNRHLEHKKKYGKYSCVTKETYDLYIKILTKSVEADKFMEVK
tara:strand:+ start:7013 stop:7201 length:189 start_codon:yes stop_codon:yes gene_type:complete